MELSTWLVYISVISLLLFSPGPSALLCISDGVKFGYKKSIPTILGGALSALLLMTVSAIGLGAVLAASEMLFLVIKILGAAYLIYLGWNSWREGAVKLPSTKTPQQDSSTLIYSPDKLFKKSFMVGISNPKDLLFFIALFPSFMNADEPQMPQYLILASTWFCLEYLLMSVYTGLGAKMAPVFANPAPMRWVNRTLGTVFVGLGGMLAVSALLTKKL
ncbi:LysE family translocator [Psychromonas sp. KJ10-2]|uniref:LysE family translocator n=1 Tax=Psychromonas sp. KJ10-2 TaxID=3391822 RepID=UPI0039B476B2